MSPSTSGTEHFEVFVYGTLLRGEHHHEVLLAGRFIRDASTRAEYDMFLVDYFPAMVRGGSLAVVGEIYSISESVLAQLDALEQAPDFYLRESITLDDGTSVLAYVLPRERLPSGARPITTGDFRRR